ncbi:MAG: NAD(P)/FAD-dependent oxidoreductase, partial [Firmicutes bacterium HGW-Firmicutes-13]
MEKIAVIGGGPAGLSAAIEAVSSGFAVTLFEKKKIGENINCAEGFFDTLKLLGEPEAGVRFRVKNIIVQMNK